MERDPATLKSYAIGFALSVFLTLVAYAIIVRHLLTGGPAVIALLILAVAQLAVQMIFFLHIGAETGERLKLTTFVITIGLVLVVVAGSIWIMGHLNYNMLASPEAMKEYIESQQAF